MEQSTSTRNQARARPEAARPPGNTPDDHFHVAIIMDGNGRWATARGQLRRTGHYAGANAVRRTVEAAPSLGIDTLTLYAFSSDNWKRPRSEVTYLMRLLLAYLRAETAACVERGVRVTVIGRRNRLPEQLRRAIADAEDTTAGGRVLHLRIALDYSARDAIVRAARLSRRDGVLTRGRFARRLGQAIHARGRTPDVDLLIRTGGEQRLSDFLLWECAYAELYFTPRFWPDFDADCLAAAVREFHGRRRRFGGLEAVPERALIASS